MGFEDIVLRKTIHFLRLLKKKNSFSVSGMRKYVTAT